MDETLYLFLMAILGSAFGGFLFVIPGVTVYTLSTLLLAYWMAHPDIFAVRLALPAFLLSLTVSYSFINTVPAMFFGAPDRSTLFLVNPGRRYLGEGRGCEGSMIVGVGSMIGILLIVASTPFYPYFLRGVRALLRYNYQWLVGPLMFYMVGEELCYHLRRARRLGIRSEYRAMAAAPVIFLLIGLFGFLTTYSRRFVLTYGVNLVSPIVGGMVLIPHLLWGVCLPLEPWSPCERRHRARGGGGLFGGAVAGYAGGLFAMFVPGMTAGPGVFLANQLSPRGKERAFLISQGVSKTLSSVGAFLLFFIPYFGMTRGNMASRLRCFYTAYERKDYVLAVAVILISAGVSFYMLFVASRVAEKMVRRVDRRKIAAVVLCAVVMLIYAFSGVTGLAYMLLSCALGSLPFLYGCNRSNVYAFILLPAFVAFGGWWGKVMALLGLIR